MNKDKYVFAQLVEFMAYYMIDEARRRRIDKIFEVEGHVYAFDSTTIDQCLSVFEWAKFRKHKGGIKIHTLYDVEAQVPAFVHVTNARAHDSKAMPEIPYEAGAHYIFDRAYNDYSSLYTINRIGAFFVLRAKSNVKMKIRTWIRRLPKSVGSDIKGTFSGYKSSKEYPEELRKVTVLDPDNGTRYIFLTNNMEPSPLLISEFYRNRWSVELFFKWVKQHLRIKKFWGTSENAVRIQIYCAIITYCLVAIIQHDMRLERSIYEVLQILGISLTDKTHLSDLFDKANFKNVNVISGSGELNLFSFLE